MCPPTRRLLPSDVQVYVSLRTKMVYVMEGDKSAAGHSAQHRHAGSTPRPPAISTSTAKDPTKRSGEYGFWVNGSDIYSGSSAGSPGSGYHYVGYPMANWVEFEPGYGFHEGYVWPVPRSHGCLRTAPECVGEIFQAGADRHAGHDRLRACLTTTPSAAMSSIRPTTKIPIRQIAVMISPDYFTQPRDSELIQPPHPLRARPASHTAQT